MANPDVDQESNTALREEKEQSNDNPPSAREEKKQVDLEGNTAGNVAKEENQENTKNKNGIGISKPLHQERQQSSARENEIRDLNESGKDEGSNKAPRTEKEKNNENPRTEKEKKQDNLDENTVRLSFGKQVNEENLQSNLGNSESSKDYSRSENDKRNDMAFEAGEESEIREDLNESDVNKGSKRALRTEKEQNNYSALTGKEEEKQYNLDKNTENADFEENADNNMEHELEESEEEQLPADTKGSEFNDEALEAGEEWSEDSPQSNVEKERKHNDFEENTDNNMVHELEESEEEQLPANTEGSQISDMALEAREEWSEDHPQSDVERERKHNDFEENTDNYMVHELEGSEEEQRPAKTNDGSEINDVALEAGEEWSEDNPPSNVERERKFNDFEGNTDNNMVHELEESEEEQYPAKTNGSEINNMTLEAGEECIEDNPQSKVERKRKHTHSEENTDNNTVHELEESEEEQHPANTKGSVINDVAIEAGKEWIKENPQSKAERERKHNDFEENTDNNMGHELEKSDEADTKENGINKHLNKSDDVKKNIKVHSAEKGPSYDNLPIEKEGSSKYDDFEENTENDIMHGLEQEAGPDLPDTPESEDMHELDLAHQTDEKLMKNNPSNNVEENSKNDNLQENKADVIMLGLEKESDQDNQSPDKEEKILFYHREDKKHINDKEISKTKGNDSAMYSEETLEQDKATGLEIESNVENLPTQAEETETQADLRKSKDETGKKCLPFKEEELESVKNELDGQKDRLRDANNEIESLRSDLENKNECLRLKEEELESVKNELEGQTDKLRDANNEIESLRSDLENKNECLRLKEEEQESIKNELEGQKDKLRDANNEIESLRSDLENKNECLRLKEEELESVKNELEGQTDKLRDANNEIESLRSDLENKNECLRLKEEEQESIKNELEGQKDKLRDANNEIESLRSDLENKNECLRLKEEELESVKNELEGQIDKLRDANNEIESLRSDLENKNKTNADLLHRIIAAEKSADEFLELRRELEAVDSDNQSLRERLSASEKSNRTMEKKNQELERGKQEKEKLHKELLERNRTIQVLQAQNQQCKNDLQANNLKFENLKQESAHKEATNKCAIEMTKQEMEKLQNELIGRNSIIQALKSEISRLKSDLDATSMENAQLKGKLSDIQTTVNQLEAYLEEKEAAKTSAFESMQKAIAERDQMMIQMGTLQNLRMENETLHRNYQLLLEQNTTLNARVQEYGLLQNHIQEYHKAWQESKMELHTEKEKNRHFNELFSKNGHRMSSMITDIQNYRRMADDNRRLLEEKTEECRRKERELDRLKYDISKKEIDLVKYTEENFELKDQNKSLEEELNMSRSECSQLRDHVHSLSMNQTDLQGAPDGDVRGSSLFQSTGLWSRQSMQSTPIIVEDSID